MNNKTYSEMLMFYTFDERFDYLKLTGRVGFDTFGCNRYMNQMFYKSKEWERIRSYVIVRDNACDLGIPDRPIAGTVYIHHIEPITVEDIKLGNPKILDPNNLVCVSFETHNALHYGSHDYVDKYKIVNRSSNDTCPWKKGGDTSER